MNVVIPPIIFYVIGTLFVVFGALRAIMLGRRRPGRELQDQDTPERARARRRHLIFGIVYVLTGLFLLASTAGLLHTRLPR
jgi:hypothetical protein